MLGIVVRSILKVNIEMDVTEISCEDLGLIELA